jgi:hypothetical protein
MGFSKRALSSAILVTLALGISQAAHAQSKYFTFDFTGTGYDATGTLFATSTDGGTSYTATSGSITVPATSAVTAIGFTPGMFSLLPSNSFEGNDNVLYPSSDGIDGAGLAFGSGSYDLKLFNNEGSYSLVDSSSHSDTGGFTIQAAAVPELSSMLGFGSFVALGGLALLRRRKPAHSAA